MISTSTAAEMAAVAKWAEPIRESADMICSSAPWPALGKPTRPANSAAGHLDTNAGEEADQGAAGQEIRKKSEFEYPCQYQHSRNYQRNKTRCTDVFRRPKRCDADEDRRENCSRC